MGLNYLNAKRDIIKNHPIITKISYRPFDNRYTLYTGYSSGFMGRPRSETMNNIIQGNLSITSTRSRRNDYNSFFITKFITDKSITSSLDNNYIFPLYLYPKIENQQILELPIEREPNFNLKVINEIENHLGLSLTPEKVPTVNTFAPIDLLDYIYAVLHSPTYREKYKEFLKIDFPRVPYPQDRETFWQLVRLGGELRQIHLLESPVVQNFLTEYPEDGDNTVTKVKYQDGKVYINEKQYFNRVPAVAWNFYIGGYQPAQKWLKDRKNRKLDFDDILHYQKIIVALTETDRIMREIDGINLERTN